MLVAGSITPTRRALAELLAEARARTVLLVSSLDSRDLALEPAPEVGSVLSELDRIVHYEKRWLLDDPEHQPVGTYDEWFDLMTEVRQRVLQALEQADLLEQPRLAERYQERWSTSIAGASPFSRRCSSWDRATPRCRRGGFPAAGGWPIPA